jgi:hypothetical protein
VVEHAPEERRLVVPFADRQSADGTLVLRMEMNSRGARSGVALRASGPSSASTAMNNETSVFTRAWGLGE